MFGVPLLPSLWCTPQMVYVFDYRYHTGDDEHDIYVTIKCMMVADNLMVYAQAKVHRVIYHMQVYVFNACVCMMYAYGVNRMVCILIMVHWVHGQFIVYHYLYRSLFVIPSNLRHHLRYHHHRRRHHRHHHQ